MELSSRFGSRPLPTRKIHHCMTLACCYVLMMAATIRSCLGLGRFPGDRIVDYPQPDYRTSFSLSSQDAGKSFRQIPHGLGKLPFDLQVKVSATEGDSAGYSFEGTGACQNAGNSGNYGGVLYAYSKNNIRIWAPTEYAGNTNGRMIFIGDGWGGDKYTQSSLSADVSVEAWKDGPEPNFQMSYEVDTLATDRPYIHQHRLHQLPDRVSVRVTALFPLEDELYYFHAAGSSQNPPNTRQFGGVTFAYNENNIKLWLPASSKTQGKSGSGCVTVGKGWGAGLHSAAMFATKCRIEVRLWIHLFPVPSFQTDWQPLAANAHEASFREIPHNLGQEPLHVIVQVKQNHTEGALVFEGLGSVMATEFTRSLYGGVVFAYNNHSIRLWAPSSDRNASGRIALISDGWGNPEDQIDLTTGLVRVLIYVNRCDNTGLTADGQLMCRTFSDTHIKWSVSDWDVCSAPCGRGSQRSSINGCKKDRISLKLSCDFEDGLCGFQSSVKSLYFFEWKRSRGSSYLSDGSTQSKDSAFFLHAYGYPKGSWFVYTDKVNFTAPSVGSLTSPELVDARNCYLQFMYRTGVYFGLLRVDVTQDGIVWTKVWSMGDDQIRKGEVWVSGYVNIGNSVPFAIKHLRFVHELQTDCGTVCASVAIDHVKLYCDGEQMYLDTLPGCEAIAMPMPGCEINVFNPVRKGNAFSVVGTTKGQFVSAAGNLSDSIAVYTFKTEKAVEYRVWIEAFSSSLSDNSVMLRIDNGTWHRWDIISKNGSVVWNSYIRQAFELEAGLHTVELQQLERQFLFRDIRISPERLDAWADLGMQSHHIDDSRLLSSLFLLTELEEGQYARLHGVAAWLPRDENVGSLYLQVSLTDVALINKVATQGGTDTTNPNRFFCFTNSYKLKVSIDGSDFAFYRNQSGLQHLFSGNNDRNTVVMHTLPYVAIAKSIRFYPWSFNIYPCMRVELYGIYLRGGMCRDVQVKPPLSRLCDGDRNCGKNAKCALEHDISINSSSSTTEKCTCLAGFHGSNCQYMGCSPDPCKNGGSCDVLRRSFSCRCPLGYEGETCQHICRQGYYGDNCRQECLCHGQSRCDPVDGTCSCEPGYDGPFCNQSCAAGTFGQSCSGRCSCPTPTICDHVDGRCFCRPGFSGPLCQTPCGAEFFGRNCSSRCRCRNGAACNQLDGSCACNSGWYGDTCSIPCLDGTFGSSCKSLCGCGSNAICSPLDGECTCFEGWTGTNCTLPCPPRWFGINCMFRCSCRWKNTKSCNRVNGDCLCEDGFSGASCRASCPMGTFGSNCGEMCKCKNDNGCDPFDGQCICDAGYMGQYCEKSCDEGRYGMTCSQECDCIEEQTEKCDFKDGSCFCKPGYHGTRCEQLCASGRWGKNCVGACSCNQGVCSPTDGLCSCFPGWHGLDCSEPCGESRFGPGCRDTCQCKNEAVCDRFNGTCACLPGFSGRWCESSCPTGTYGPSCQEVCGCSDLGTSICDAVSGRCICKLGFHGNNCSQICPDGSFGAECRQRCLPCPHSQGACDKRHGNCSCLLGFHGYACLDDCDWSHFGYQCLGHCACASGYLCSNLNGDCYEAEAFTVKLALVDGLALDAVRRNESRLLKHSLERLLQEWHPLLEQSTPLRQRREVDEVNRYIVRVVKETMRLGEDGERVLLLTLSVLVSGRPVPRAAMESALRVIGASNISTAIGCPVFAGQLRPHGNADDNAYMKWIITGAAGALAFVALFALIIVWKRYHRPISSIYKVKRNSVDMELRPCLGVGSGHVLAFDNPYYDVIAAMGLDDDIEEDYYNPLYDDASLFDDDRGSETDGYYHSDEANLYHYDRDSGISSGTLQ